MGYDAIDHTYAASLHHCQRMHQHRYYEGLEPVQPSTRLLMGKAGHAAIQALHQKGSDPKPALDALWRVWGDHKPTDLPWLTLSRMESVIEEYVKHYRDREPYRNVLVCEEPLIATIDGLTIGGIPDRIVDDVGKLRVVDLKFTTGYLENLKTKLRFGHQLRTYCLLGAAKIERPITSALADIVRITDKKTEFIRQVYDYTADQLAETLEWFKSAENREESDLNLRKWDETYNLPQNPGVHCKYCDFAQLCEAPKALRKGRKRMYFRVVERKGQLASGADGDV